MSSSAFTRRKSIQPAALEPSPAPQTGARDPKFWSVSGRLRQFSTNSIGRAALFIGLLAALLWAPYLWFFSARENGEQMEQRWLVGRSGLENIELHLLDTRFTARGVRVPASADKIAIIGIDQNSMGRIGKWPWPRALHARLIDKLKAAGARVIVLDFDFSDHQNLGASNALSSNDLALIKATKNAGNVALASLLVPETGANGELSYQLNTPFSADPNGGEGLDEQTLDLGVAFLPADSDGRFRRYPFALQVNGETLGGLAPLGCAIYQKTLDAQSSERYQNALQRGLWPAALDATLAGKVTIARHSSGKRRCASERCIEGGACGAAWPLAISG